MNIFYLKELKDHGIVVLDEEESKHLAKVLRLEKGDTVYLTNGLGLMLESKVIESKPKAATLEILRQLNLYPERPFSIHIAVAPTKNIDRIEWFLEKAVELGIEEISFIKTQRSERKNINQERMHKIAVSAMKQSLKPNVPFINDLVDFNKFLKGVQGDQKFIAHLENDQTPHLKKIAQLSKNYVVLIGPEGDFTESEINLAKEAGFNVVSLGPYRLRTETAALTSCNILNLINQA